MAYNETTLRNEILNANNGDIIEITADFTISNLIVIDKIITIRSAINNYFTILKNTANKHFNIVGGTLTLLDIKLDGMNIGGGVSFGMNGHLIMDSGAVIKNCYSSSNGGAIAINSSGTGITATAVMKNGSVIENCSCEMHGGGVFVGFQSSFTMEDGSVIRGCESKEYGGGVYIMEGTFIMNGGEISDCSSIGGGGVFLYYVEGGPSQASIRMYGGKITGCSAPFGGGIIFLNTMQVERVNTVITGNYSGTYGGGLAILTGNFSNITTELITGNTAFLADDINAQIYIYSEHYYTGNEFTFEGSKSSGKIVALLSGEERNLMYFKILYNNTGESLVGFCSELGQGIDDYYLRYFLPNVRLNREQTDKLAITIRVALGTERSYDVISGNAELSLRAYVAQYVIWNIIIGYSKSEELRLAIPRIRAALGDSAADCFDEIISEISRYENQTLPSFAGVCYPMYDPIDSKYKITLTDTNNVLQFFVIDPSSVPQGLEVTLDYDNNTMTIICSDKSILLGGKANIRLISMFENGDASVYFHPLYQDLVIPDNIYEVSIIAYIRPLLRAVGDKPCPCYSKTTKCRKTIKGKKIWVDNTPDKRPSAVEITLYRNNEFYDSIIIDETNNWSYIFCCVPIWDSTGNKYKYQVDEVIVPDGYTKTIEEYNIINTLIASLADI